LADTYKPTGAMASNARKAIKFKEDGKANGAGTNVGWTRAHQLASGESLSLDTVKRMYSFFSRHEVDKKGKNWGSQADPSNGYIMWLAWGGDAGFSWSRAIVHRAMDKEIFADFGADYSMHQTLVFKGAGVGDMVSWNSSGGTAHGKIVRIVRDGKYNVPNSSFTVTGTENDPAAVVRVYQDGKPTDTIVGHKLSSLRR
jgi:hypothetical protein